MSREPKAQRENVEGVEGAGAPAGRRSLVASRYPALARMLDDRGGADEPTIHDAATVAVEHKDGGAAVDPGVAARVGAHLGADFGTVRVHSDPLAQQATAAMGARAFAYGGDVFLGPGESGGDLGLMAHELTHVAQQGAAGRRAPQRVVQVGNADSPAEREADQVSAGVTGGQSRPASLLVDNGPIGPGQMLKSQFIEQLRAEVTAAADAELGPVYSAIGCPYIERYFSRYAGQPAASSEVLLRRYAPATRTARTAAEMIPAVVARVREGVRTWRDTGRPPPDIAAFEPAAAQTTPGQSAGAPTGMAKRAEPDGTANAASPLEVRTEATASRRAVEPEAEPGSTAAVLERLGAGSSLPSSVAARMESAFGDRFDDVRIHTDQDAQAQAREQGALALTIGHHVAFAAGQFRPGSPEGDALLAHELAHVQQQRGGGAQALARKAIEVGDEPAAEQDADRAAEGVLRRLYGGATSAAGRIGASLSTGVGLKRCPEKTQQQQAPDRDAGARDGDAGDAGTADAAPAVTEATVTTALQADPVDPVAVLTQLRQLPPVGESATPGPLDTLIDTRLTGDARWRAQNLRRYGPEDHWPPILRGDTAATISAARSKITSGTAPEPAAAVADAMRPINPTAQHQAITVWRNDIPAARFGGSAQRTAYFDSVTQLLDGPRFGPTDNLAAVPPILDLETRSEDELYTYFQQLCSARGYTFAETDVSQAINDANPLKYNAFNIRGYDQTTTTGALSPRLSVTHRTDFTGHMFLAWQDATGRHVRNWEWSNTGIGATKLNVTHRRGDDLLDSEGGVERFSRDSRGQVSGADRRAIRADRDAEAVARAAQQLAADAGTAAGNARTQAAAAETASGDRSRAGVATTGTQALAQTALVTALGARQTADRAILNADRAIALLRRAAPPAGVAPPADSKTAAETAKATAAAAFETARGAWLIARQQLLATQEVDTRREWERLEADPAATADQRRTAREAYDAARRQNNVAYGEGNTGQMSENNALPWLQEGQYVAHLRSGDKGGHPFWAVDSGIGNDGSGTSPVDRDWDADGSIDPGERDVPGTAVGTGILIHRGDSTQSSIGCQVAPEDPYSEFVEALSGQGRPARSFAYIVVEARNLSPWTGTPSSSGPADGGTSADGGG